MLSWGVADFFAKKAVDRIGAVQALVINQAVALGPILVYAIVAYSAPTFTAELAFAASVTGILGFLGYLYLYKGLKKGALSVVSPISASWFVITTLVASFLFKETLTSLQILGVAMVFAGVFLASTNLAEFKRDIGKGKSNGVFEALVAMVAWGFAFAFIKPVIDQTSPIMALLLARAAAFTVLFTWVGANKTKIVIPTKLIFLFIVTAGLLDAFGYATYNVGVTTEFVSIISPIAAAYPVVTILLARFFLKEQLAQTQKIGVTAILAGLVLMALV